MGHTRGFHSGVVTAELSWVQIGLGDERRRWASPYIHNNECHMQIAAPAVLFPAL